VLSVCVPGADSEALLMQLDLAGVAASGGSACTSGAAEPSHVLTAMGVPRNLALGAIRFGLGRTTTEAELDHVADLFPKLVAKVRALAGALARA
jgi:cysteine desulfurase